jgi:hypothetical protein
MLQRREPPTPNIAAAAGLPNASAIGGPALPQPSCRPAAAAAAAAAASKLPP